MDHSKYVHEIPGSSWEGPFPEKERDDAARALEDGRVVLLPRLAFELSEREKRFLTPDIVGSRKNVSYDRKSKKLGGTVCTGNDAADLAAVMQRFGDKARALLDALIPAYKSSVVQGRTSLRPVQAAGRQSSWRKDDTRLHVDAFPATPVAGRRILRIFSNVNQNGEPRRWRVGEPFADIAAHFAPSVPAPFPGSAALMQLLHFTRGRRTPYDHYMLQLHDRMKADDNYQKNCPQFQFPFPPGATWMVFTDQVPHAVISGQHQFEQTFYLPVNGMVDPEKSPLKVLERLTGKALV
jgi:hypothetical protein